MTNISVTAEKNGTVYNVPIRIGMDFFDAKFDTGSSTTVIAASVFYDGWSDEELKKLESFCESKGCVKREFTSASGHKIAGYPVVATDIWIGDTEFKEFHYYLITNGRKEMSLLGDDFIENCGYHHLPHGNIEINTFDDEAYMRNRDNSLSNEDFLKFIDAVLSET